MRALAAERGCGAAVVPQRQPGAVQAARRPRRQPLRVCASEGDAAAHARNGAGHAKAEAPRPVVLQPPAPGEHPSLRLKGCGEEGRPCWPQKSSLFLFRTDGKSCSRELVTGTGQFHFAHPSTQQHLLVWRDRPKTVMVIKKLGAELTDEFMQVVTYLTQVEQLHVVVEPHMYARALEQGMPGELLFTYNAEESKRLSEYVDFVICLGGDGVLLHASSLFKRSIPPVVSFHLGSMGFLTNHFFEDFKAELRQVIYGAQKLDTCSMDSQDLPPNSNHLGVMITLRMRLECAIVRAGHAQPEQVYEVLNEIVVDRGSNSFLTNIEAYIGGRFITRVQADGIMLATPTGSTAYSVAAGGSMVHPNVQAILLTPICPHSLNFRPIVLPDYTEMELRVPDSARVSAWVCFDGKQRQELHRGDSVFIKMSENPVPTINRTDLTTDWFESLERCFHWSTRPEQKRFQEDWVSAAASAGAPPAPSSSGSSSGGGSGGGALSSSTASSGAADGAGTLGKRMREGSSDDASSSSESSSSRLHAGNHGSGSSGTGVQQPQQQQREPASAQLREPVPAAAATAALPGAQFLRP